MGFDLGIGEALFATSAMEATATAGLAAGAYGPVALGSASALGSVAAGIGSAVSSIAPIAGIAGTVAGAYGKVAAGQQSAAAANYNAAVAANNAQIATENAKTAMQVGNEKVANEQQRTRAELGGIKAAQAANGVDINSGSNVDVRSSAAELGELNAISIRQDAARQAYGYQTQAQSNKSEAELLKQEAGYDVKAGNIAGGTTLLTGAVQGSQSGLWDNYLMSGALNG